MDYNSKNIRVVKCRGRRNLPESACQKSCESNQNWRSYGQKRPPTLRKFSFMFCLWNSVIEARCFHYAKINIKLDMNDIRQERSDEGPTLKLNKRFKWTSFNKKFGAHIKESMAFEGLKK